MNSREWRSRVLLVVASTLVFFGGAELACRIAFRDEKKISSGDLPGDPATPPDERLLLHQYHPILGFENKPSFTTDFWNHKIVHNSRGERGPEYPYERSPGKQRILLIGDSGTWGYPLAEEEIPSSQLMAALKKRAPERELEIINEGVIGYATDQEYLTYLLKGRRYKPDVVVLNFFSGNDLWELLANAAWGVRKPSMKILVADEGSEPFGIGLFDVPVPKLAGWPERSLVEVFGIGDELKGSSLVRRSAFVRFLLDRQLTAQWAGNPEMEKVRGTEAFQYLRNYIPYIRTGETQIEPQRDYALRDQKGADLFLEIVRALSGVVQKDGAKLIITMLPSPEIYREGEERKQYDRIKARLLADRIPVVDLKSLAKDRSISEEELFTYSHPTALGNRLAAEALADIVPGGAP